MRQCADAVPSAVPSPLLPVKGQAEDASHVPELLATQPRGVVLAGLRRGGGILSLPRTRCLIATSSSVPAIPMIVCKCSLSWEQSFPYPCSKCSNHGKLDLQRPLLWAGPAIVMLQSTV